MANASDPPGKNAEPLVAGRYRLGRVIGTGGQGHTHAALDEKTGQHVAVKVFPLKDVKDWKQLDLFRRECRVLRDLSHPGVPRFLDECNSDDNGSLCLVMELVRGRNLRELMRESGPLSEAELWRILWQMAQVLDFLHSRNPPVVHRDIKPHNIILRDDGQVVLVDFGVVQRAPRSDGNTFVGTYGFMAPEQFHGESTPASDIYGLGATLISLGTGVEPEALPHEGLRLQFEGRMQVSAKLLDVLKAMVEPEPAKRVKDGGALVALLEGGIEKRRVVDEEPAHHGVPAPVQMAIAAMLVAIGSLGAVALTVVGTVFVPMVFMILGMVMPDKRKQLEARRDDVQDVLRLGSESFRSVAGQGMHELSSGRKQLGPRAERPEERIRKAKEHFRKRMRELE